MYLLELLTRDDSPLFIETCTVQLWNAAGFIFANRKHFQVLVSSQHLKIFLSCGMGKRKGTWREHLCEGWQFFIKLDLTFITRAHLEMLVICKSWRNTFGRSTPSLWQRCLHPSRPLSSHLFDQKRETGAELQAKEKECRAQLCHFYQSVLALFVLWDRSKWEFYQ